MAHLVGLKIVIEEIGKKSSLLFRTFKGLVYSGEGKKNLFQAASDEAESNGQEDENGDGKSGTQDVEPSSAGLFHGMLVFR